MADLDLLLEKTSRTFALSIPLLPEPTRREVTVAYLLFRVADTFEDSSRWPRRDRIEALDAFCEILERPEPAEAERLAAYWVSQMPLTHEGYHELMNEMPFVLERYAELSDEARELVREHTIRTARGMAGFVASTGDDGRLQLKSLQDLRDYCYVVAGIVGDMLTELYLVGRESLAPVALYLRERSRAFGEGLQLVNILKDSAADVREGRAYIPPGVERSEVFALARRDLEAASEYTLELQGAGAERGLVAFNALPVRLARATLDHIEREGPGAKISRDEVWRSVASLDEALEANRPAVSPPIHA